jgi:ribosomal protein S18 acetylase RimI-like enzyme
MTIRKATLADLDTLAELLREFEAEVPEPPHREVDFEKEAAEARGYIEEALALLAEEEGGRPMGFALAKLETPRICFLSDLYVRPEARRRGIARELIGAVGSWGSERGAEVMTLEVLTTNIDGRALYDRLGFDEESRNLVTPLPALVGRLVESVQNPSFGSIHVQTDDVEAVLRAVHQYVPRLPGNSRGSAVTPPRNGWTAVYDELCDRDPPMLRRLAVELSDRMGAVVLSIGVEHGDVVRYVLFERGSIVDEYLSVPEYHGPLPPGDVIGLGANPTVVARLTGADAARVRDVARTARSPAGLPPAPELLDELAAVMGVDGATLGYSGARHLDAVTLLDRL